MVENNKTGKPLEYYRAEFMSLDPGAASSRCKAPFDMDKKRFTVSLFGHMIYVYWPDFQLEAVNCETCPVSLLEPYAQILILRYLLEGTDSPHRGDFLSYREFPWGAVYDANFQGRCIKRLAFGFGYKIDSFADACEKLGGTRLSKGDASYEFPVMGSAHLRLIMYGADDEFPPSSQFLFSGNCETAFSAEDLVVVGDLIINTLKELAKK